MKRPAFDRNYGKWFANDVQRAVKKYRMIRLGETIRVALSGGKDSVTLLYILAWLRRFSPLEFGLEALHVRTADYDTSALKELCRELEVDYHETELENGPASDSETPCYLCARLKRGAMARILPAAVTATVAYGHHAEDAAETLFMNMIETRRLGSFSPRVSVEKSRMVIIRPMIYLAEETVRRIHRHAELPLLEYRCPHENSGTRQRFKGYIAGMNSYFGITDFSRRVVDAIENIDTTNIWHDLE